MSYVKITEIEQMKEISDGYFLRTKLQNPVHVQKDDVLHKYDCKVIKETVMYNHTHPLTKMPTNHKYFHIKSSDEEGLKKYAEKRTCRCWD